MSKMIVDSQTTKPSTKNIPKIPKISENSLVNSYQLYELPTFNDGYLIVSFTAPILFYKQTEILEEINLNYLVLEETYYYKVNTERLQRYYFEPTEDGEINFQVIEKSNDKYSFLVAMLFGYKIEIDGKSMMASFLNLGNEFSQSRFPIRIRVHGEGQIRGAFAKCSHEEIIKNNEHDFILYFHEYCPNGPDI